MFQSWMESYESLCIFLDKASDPRTKDWFLVRDFRQCVFIIAFYVLFCKKIGPWFMKNRKPFELKNTIIVYNATNIVACIYILYEGCQAGWMRGYSLTCQPIDYSNHPDALRMTRAVWWYLMLKHFDLLDTVFFVLRKKTAQVSFLHVYHHGGMILLAYIGTRFFPGGHGTSIGFVNSIVHVVMYFYYLLSGLGPSYRKYLWWKKYITMMQMAQFAIILLHFSQVLYRDCDYPKFPIIGASINAFLMIYLFGSFYYETYIKKKTS